MPTPVRKRYLPLALCLGLILLRAAGACATELPPPQGDVVLTVSGAITVKNTASAADFDLAMLQALPKAVIKTGTPWTEGVSTFEGAALSDLLRAVGAAGSTLKAVALNDYAVELPSEDAQRGAIVAYKLNGSSLSVRDKGPLWIIYPFDSTPDLKTETMYARSIWQLRWLTVGN